MIRALRPVRTPAWLLGSVLAGLIPAAASAHAIVLESSPPPGAVLARSPAQITLRFNSKIEKRFTRLTLATGNQPPAPVTAASDEPAAPEPESQAVALAHAAPLENVPGDGRPLIGLRIGSSPLARRRSSPGG